MSQCKSTEHVQCDSHNNGTMIIILLLLLLYTQRIPIIQQLSQQGAY